MRVADTVPPGRRRVRPSAAGVALVVAAAAGGLLGGRAFDPTTAGIVLVALVGWLVVGVVGSLAGAAEGRPQVRAAPSDAEVGTPVALIVGGEAGPSTALEWTPERRGVLDRLVLVSSSSAPLGVLRIERSTDAVLPGPLYVAPVPVPREAPAVTGPTQGQLVAGSAPSGAGELTRSVRPYVAGDPRRSVHWRSSARRGQLVVREVDPPEVPALAVTVALPAAPGPAESVAGSALGIVEAALAEGRTVWLGVAGPDGPMVGVVDRRTARRRLAAAVTGPAPAAPPGWQQLVVDR